MEAEKKTMECKFHRVGGASCYVRICQALPEHMWTATREVTKLFTAPNQRQRGYATTLMHKLCHDADLTDTTLLLFADAFDTTYPSLNQSDLESWYSVVFGFQIIQKNPTLMARPPGATPKVGLKLNPMTRAVLESVSHE